MIVAIVTILAPAVTCFQLVPQLYQVYSTKQVDDLSFLTLLLLVTSATLWTLHGFFIQYRPLLFAAAISLLVNTSLLFLYLLYRKVDLVETTQ